MKITILTLFPEFFENFFQHSITKRALAKGVVSFQTVNIRDFHQDKHRRVDFPPIGGGAGLILAYPPIKRALESIRNDDSYVVLLSPRGQQYQQSIAHEFSQKRDLILICGHYEGIDERVYDLADAVISIGDYILTGGEIAALSIIDSTMRLLDGAISSESLNEESFSHGLLEYPQYCEPFSQDDQDVPLILYSGNHQAISRWRLKQSLRLTQTHRPDLFAKYELNKKEIALLDEPENPEWEVSAIAKGKKFTNKN